MKSLKIFLVCAILFLLERVFFTRFEIFSLTPWLMFAFCLISAAVKEELGSLPVIAGLCGLAADLSGGGATGSAMASFAISAALVHFFAARIFRNSLIISLAAVFAVGIFGEMLYFVLNSGGAVNFSKAAALWSVALPLSAINTLFALIMYPLAKRMFRRKEGLI